MEKRERSKQVSRKCCTPSKMGIVLSRGKARPSYPRRGEGLRGGLKSTYLLTEWKVLLDHEKKRKNPLGKGET